MLSLGVVMILLVGFFSGFSANQQHYLLIWVRLLSVTATLGFFLAYARLGVLVWEFWKNAPRKSQVLICSSDKNWWSHDSWEIYVNATYVLTHFNYLNQHLRNSGISSILIIKAISMTILNGSLPKQKRISCQRKASIVLVLFRYSFSGSK